MRLVCPNCDAEYEVDAAAIPLAGRDVQCSNCGHAWFQAHPEVEAAEEERLDEVLVAEPVPVVVVPERVEAGALAEPVAVPQRVVQPEAGALAEGPGGVTPLRSMDETVLAVLREEAERESAARRAEAAVPARAPVMEVQTELPLAQDETAAVRRVARLRGTDAEPEALPVPPKSRREMLPAIEEINSTLRATSDRTSAEDSAIYRTMGEAPAGQRGFRHGFVSLVLAVVIMVALYLTAPVIGARVPVLAGAAAGYVAFVDMVRVAVDAGLKSLIGALRGLAGGQGG